MISFKRKKEEKHLPLRISSYKRMIIPYLRKLRQGEITGFDGRCGVSSLASFGLGVITTILIFPKFEVAQIGQGAEAMVKLFCLAFGFGYAANSMVSEGVKWVERKGRKK